MIPSNYSFHQPSSCIPSQCIAILIPARNRDKHLRHLLYNLPEILVNQLSCFGIYVLDQYDDQTTFNKAKLFNSGVLEAKKDKPWDCFVFHDVDLLLKNQSILYQCESDGNPLHLSVAIDKYNYRLFHWYETTVGGVSLFDWRAIEMINGWSNEFWGWGGEDDNMYNRLVEAGFTLKRPEFKCENPKTLHRKNKLGVRNRKFGIWGDKYSFNCGTWQMIAHGEDSGNPVNSKRLAVMKSNNRSVDGISNTDYRLVQKEVKLNGLFSYVLIDVKAIDLEEFQKQNDGKHVWKDNAHKIRSQQRKKDI